MSLLDSIKSIAVNTAMSRNTSLAHITSTTFSATGTSINGIRQGASSAVDTYLGPNSYSQQLYDPVSQMTNYALANTTNPLQISAINTASTNAIATIDSSLNSNFPTGISPSGVTGLQNAATEALSNGVSSFGNALGFINPSLVSPALGLGNSALTQAGSLATNLTSGVFNAADNAINSSVSSINSAVSSLIAEKNAALSALDSLGSSSASTIAAANPFSSAGVTTVTEGISNRVNDTDVVYQNVKLYVEGVQVPYVSISISQSIGTLPKAMIEIPPDPGLLDVTRYYQPKVHIFYSDQNYGGDRLLFWGHMVAANYMKSRAGGSSSVVFTCEHKNAQLTGLTLEFSGYASNVTTNLSDPNADQAVAKVNNLNSQLAIILAMQGLTGVQQQAGDVIDPSNSKVSDADVCKLSKRFVNFQNRFVGMPSAIMNFWNQLKKECYSNTALNTIMADMYIPLVEDGLGFFDRMAGHYYIEEQVESSKEGYCPGGVTPASVKNPVMIPPVYQLNSISAIKSSLGVSVVTSMLGFSGELTNFMQLFTEFYSSIEYEILTLASPAQIPADPTLLTKGNSVNVDNPSSFASTPLMAVETVVKPQVPFYYSPICNVLFPRMYHTISISQDESAIPSRLTAFSDIMPGDQGLVGSQYRGPNSIRESVAFGAVMQNNTNKGSNLPVDLQGTTGQSYNVPGKYETGRGVRNKRIIMPNWLAQMLKGKLTENGSPNVESWPDKTDPSYQAVCDLHAAWIERYGFDVTVYEDGTSDETRNTTKDVLDPYSQKSNIHPFQRLLFATADYEYTKAVVSSRMGTIDAIFNPYIIPGYPMEILDDSPNAPCFHAMCSSVTHSFTSRSIGTTIGVIAACTYTEMVNYYMQPIHPWLQTALKVVNTSPGASGKTSIQGDGYGNPPEDINVNSSILFNDVAKDAADQFYKSVLGVGSVSIDDLYDFEYGRVIPVVRLNGLLAEGSNTSIKTANGGEANDYLTAVGNLRLVRRPIEGKNAIQDKFGINFIDLTQTNYNETSYKYINPILQSAYYLEPGQSMFLDYQETADFIANSSATSKTASTTTSATTGSGAPIAFGGA